MVFNFSPYAVLNNAYPDKYKFWELNVAPSNFWDRQTAFELVKWLIEDKYKFSEEDIKEKFSKTWVMKIGYERAMDFVEEDTFGIIDTLYPNKFKPWEFKQVGIDYWNSKTIGEAMRWLIEDKLGYTTAKEIRNNLTIETIANNGLSRLTFYIYKKNLSKYDLINLAYPNKYKEWEVTEVSTWTDEKKINAIKWIVEEKLKLNPKTELNKVRARNFIEYGLSGLLALYGNSPKKALSLAYNKITK